MASLESQLVGFSTELYQMIVAEKPAENVFISPTSIALVLYMVLKGAGGNTAAQITKVMKIQNIENENLVEYVKRLMKTFKTKSADYQLSVANKLFPHMDKTILDDYIKEVATSFQTEVTAMDFTKVPEQCRLEINKWVEEETNSKIKNLIGPGVITPLTAMVLANAIYFKGDWQDKFSSDLTERRDFKLSSGDAVSVDMMSKTFKKAFYGEDTRLSCKVLQLPYKGAEISMIIFLPNTNDDLSALEGELSGQVLTGLISNLNEMQVAVSLPKFKVETSYQLAELLAKLGMPDLFDMDKADLSKMSQEQLFVSHVIHKAFIEVNEEGSEAAAATAAVIQRRSLPIVMQFVADHPFMYVIWDKRLNVPLFMGKLVKPPASDALQKQEL